MGTYLYPANDSTSNPCQPPHLMAQRCNSQEGSLVNNFILWGPTSPKLGGHPIAV